MAAKSGVWRALGAAGPGAWRAAAFRRALAAELEATAADPRAALRLPRGALDRRADDSLAVLAALGAAASRDAARRHRLRDAALRSGLAELTLDRLQSADESRRVEAARVCGLLGLTEAGYWLERLLRDDRRDVRIAAARALGRLGGRAACESLKRAALYRRGPAARLAVELARAAPDHYLEGELRDPANSTILPILALAAELRRDAAAVPDLIPLLDAESPRTRLFARHALLSLRRAGSWAS